MTGPAVPERAPQLLFVCTANRVRSAFAEAAARADAEHAGIAVEIRSAGLLPGGAHAVDEMVTAGRRFGLDLSTHVSTQVSGELLHWADLVVPMTGQHVLDLIDLDRVARDRTVTLGEWAAATRAGRGISSWQPGPIAEWAAAVATRPLDSLLSGSLDVADPIGRPARFYRRAAAQIDELLATCFGTTRA